MNFECPQCNTPLARSGQRFCNRCGTDVTSYYESLGVSLPATSGESESSSVNVLPEEMQTLEIQLSTASDEKAKPSGSHTVAFDMSEITQAAPPLDASAPQKAMLRIVLPSSDVFDRELKKLETQIGKGPRNDIVIADPAVSTSHAVLRAENAGYTITDIGSRNGTSVNGKRITSTEKLNHGDVIGMGVTKLTFRFADYSETGVIQMPDITAITQSAPLPLTEESLAYALVGENLLSQMQISTLRGSGAKGRRLYRAIVEEKLVGEEKLRDVMSRVFHMQTTNLRDAQIDETLTAKFPIKLAQEAWVFPVLETAQQLTLAVADPTNSQAINEVKGRVNPNIELRLATASEIIEQTERHYGPKLVGVLPSGDKIEYSLNRHETEIGKAAHNHIVLTDPTVSNTHAIILNRDGGYSIVDLGSRNGTFLNGERLTTHARTLKHGDTIQMGQTVWTFRNALETPENVTAILSPQALEEVRRRAGFGNSGNQPMEAGAPTPPAFPLANQAVNVATPPQDASAPPIPGGVLVAPLAATPDDGSEKKKKKKTKENQERERVKAAYIRAIGGILATVMSAVLTVVLTITVMRSGSPFGGSNPSTNTAPPIDIPRKGNAKFKLTPPSVGTAFQGGTFEASGAIQVPNTDGIYFVDNGKPKEIFWLPLDQSGKQTGAIKPIAFGAQIEDPESIAYGGSFFYVMSSLSYPQAGDKNCLLRFALDPLTQNLQGQPEVMTGIREFLIENVAELKPLGGLAYNEGGINIEGMAWDAVHDRLLLGFRSPAVNGNALLVPIRLRDPRGSFSTQNLITEPAIQISLAGLGIRDIEYDSRSGAFLIIAGSTAQGEAKDFVLYEWTGETDSSKPDAAPVELAKLDAKMKPEGITRVKIGGRDFLIVTGDASSYLKLDILE
jgi:pSer/pThr/pTyr-binding forkhead associated (FHA) protein